MAESARLTVVRRGIVFVAMAVAPAWGFVACSSTDEPAAPPRQLLPVPVDATDEDGHFPNPPVVGDGGDADGDALAPSFVVATGAGGQPDPAVATGDHSCAIAGPEHSVYCWGANDHGQAGTGVPDGGIGGFSNDIKTATKVATDEQGLPFSGIETLSLAAWHSCARRGTDLLCWGQRFTGAQAEPPAAANPDRMRPRLVGAFPIADVSAAGPHTCILRGTGHIACFGHSFFDELGRSKAADVTCTAPIFYDYPGLAGAPHTCSGEITDMAAPTTGVQALAAGELHNCALIGGGVKCWGTNATGQIGNPVSGVSELNPQDVLADPAAANKPLDGVTQIAAGGGKQTCAISAGKTFCWGSNGTGELGVSDPVALPFRASAAAVPGMDAIGIGVGDGVSCAIKPDSTVWCWGADDVGQLGDGVPKPFSSSPVQVKGPGNIGFLTSVKSVAPGRRHVCARLVDLSVWCWGKNDRGQLGDGSGVDSLYPVKVKGIP
jgi:alpha-tubulin suppressor-like RCC1 family protein